MSLSRQLWRTVEGYQVLCSPAALLISAQHKESPVRLGWVGGWASGDLKDALIYLMAIAEANHRYFIAGDNCGCVMESALPCGCDGRPRLICYHPENSALAGWLRQRPRCHSLSNLLTPVIADSQRTGSQDA